MQSQNRFFDDISKVLNGLAGTVAGVGREAESSARERAKEWVGGMDFVSREEFEAVKEMAAKARAEADALKKRLDALEKGASGPANKPADNRVTTRKPATRKAAAPKAAASKTAAPKTDS